MARFFMTVDGGGTKSECLLFDAWGKVLSASSAADANSNFTSPAAAAETIGNAMETCVAQAGLLFRALECVFLFIPAFAPCLPALKERLGDIPVYLFGDVNNALYGALGGGPGIVVLAGTGSFAVGMDAAGRTVSVGGWGSMFGDEGSGYAIGVACLRHVAGRFDEGAPPDLLTHQVLAALGFTMPEELRMGMYQPGVTRRHVADLCRVTAQAAIQGDRVAQSILNEAAIQLASLAETAHRRISGETMTVSLIGGVSKIGTCIVHPFVDELAKRCPELVYKPPLYTPVIGGMLYGMCQVGIDIRDKAVAENIEAFAHSRA